MKNQIINSLFFKKLFVNYIVPMNRTLGIKLKAIDENGTVLIMKGRRKTMNYGGSVHGAAIMALAETVHGIAVLNKIGAFENLMVTKNCNLKFYKKAKGHLKTSFLLNRDQEAYIKSQLSKSGKCEIELKSVVKNIHDDPVAELTALYHIKTVVS